MHAFCMIFTRGKNILRNISMSLRTWANRPKQMSTNVTSVSANQPKHRHLVFLSGSPASISALSTPVIGKDMANLLKDLPRLEIRIWHECEYEWWGGGGRGKKRTAGCKQESITFSTEPNRGQLFFSSSMYRLLVPAHILSAKRALYHHCSWFVSGWWSLQTSLQSLFFVVVVHPPVCHFVIFYSKWMCIICLEAFLLSHKARCPHHHHISWSSYVSPVCIRHTHPLTKPLSRSGPLPQLCFNHTCAPPFNTHTQTQAYAHHDHYH